MEAKAKDRALASAGKNSSAAMANDVARFARRAQRLIGIRGEVGILLTSSSSVRRLNRQFRKKDKATDVLSFPPVESKSGGDIAIALPVAAVQARNFEHTLLVEVKLLVLHGLLHLAGYDHEQDKGAMARKEEKLRLALNLPACLTGRRPDKRGRSTARRKKA